MSMWSSSRPGIQAKVLTKLPATLTATGGLAVNKANGIWTFSPDWTTLDSLSSISDPDNTKVWVFNTSTETYNTISLTEFLASVAQTGTGYSIPYTIDLSATTDADPGAGKLRFDNSTQNATTTLYADLLDSGQLMDWTTVLDSFDDAANTVKGQWSISKIGDSSKRIVGTLSAVTTATGYRKLTVAVTGYSSASPFASGDAVLFTFTRSGDTPTGDVSGPASSTDNNLPLFDGITGKLLKDSGTTVTATGRALLDDASTAAQRVTLQLQGFEALTHSSLGGL